MPGGGLEPNEDSSAAAIREVMEEAGVIGQLVRCLGSFEVCLHNNYCMFNQLVDLDHTY